MSMNFSAMQYEKAFDAKKLRNWEVQKEYKIGEPRTHVGFTTVVANERGHLLPGVQRSKESPWGNYVGTWDLPNRVPGNYIDVSTGRAQYAQEKLKRDAEDFRRARQEKVEKKAACGSQCAQWQGEAEGNSQRTCEGNSCASQRPADCNSNCAGDSYRSQKQASCNRDCDSQSQCASQRCQQCEGGSCCE